ncbi:MAG: calcium-transporting P-type ATPase, PMR1-type [Aigarchaeota archaeon]|nr:calcium-transporting P-type ATPase, PMR1-type [Aigarchaeota archaeon]
MAGIAKMVHVRTSSFHSKDKGEVFRALASSPQGLSEEEAKRRLEEHGPNELTKEKGKSPIVLFLKQFKNFLIVSYLVAVTLSVLVGHTLEAATMIVMIVASVTLGFVQEYRSERALEFLQKIIAPRTTVLRDGREHEISSRELVPGDVVLFKTGDRIPADARIVEAANLKTDESSLTGESVPVEKNTDPLPGDTVVAERSNMAFKGTIVTYGHGMGLVTATGMGSEFGKIATMVQMQRDEGTPLEKKMAHVGRWLGTLCLIVAGAITFLGLLKGYGYLTMMIWGISLAIAAFPDSLPAIVTGALAIGVRRMARRNSIVRRLPAVETLGSTSVICADKTGTMTKGEMTVREIYMNGETTTVSGTGYEPEGEFHRGGHSLSRGKDPSLRLILGSGALCNDAKLEKGDNRWVVVGDPTEGALVVAAAKAGLREDRLKRHPRIGEIQFTSERKRMTTIHESPKGVVAYMKGAPAVVLERCDSIYDDGRVKKLSSKTKREILQANEEMANKALRNLAVAYRKFEKAPETFDREIEKGFTFLGIVGMMDPPREEVKDAIKLCERAGIKVVMITGDNKLTAIAVAKKLGMVKNDETMVLTGAELDKLSGERFEEIVERVVIYARVLPEQKVRIVKALRKRGHVVAMTGDGVNDAPALKRADIGVAMGITGTDVTKEASDMTLADDNFQTIVAAVEEGRKIYGNIGKYLAYLLSGNISEMLIIAVAALVGLPWPLTALQLLWINMVTDGLPALALSVDPPEPDILDQPPRDPKKSIFTRRMKIYFAGYPALVCIATFLMYNSWLGIDLTKARTLLFTTLVMFEMFDAQNVRSLHHSVFKIGILSNKYLVTATASSFLLQIAVVSIPPLQEAFGTTWLAPLEWVLVLAVASTALVSMEIAKFVGRRGGKLR